MFQLNLPQYNFKVKKTEEKFFIFDEWRKKYVSLTPEEFVRQHFIRFLVEEKHFPAALISIEHELQINGMKRRCDAVLFDRTAQPQLIIELKAPHIALSQAVFDQIAIYNSKLKVDFFMLSNGLQHYCCHVNLENCQYDFFQEIPDYEELKMN